MVKQQSSLPGKVAYALVFVLLLPAILLFWAYLLDRSIAWPVPNIPLLALGSILGGIILLLKGMFDLVVFGQGLPMNAYPTQKLVTQGSYSLFPDPIYLGAILVSAGVALWIRSSSGLYIVTPILVLMTLSLVYGYERLDMERRFGSRLHVYSPLFALPRSTANRVRWQKKLALSIRIFLPWMLAGYFVDYARCTQSCNGAFIGLEHPQQWQNWLSTLWVLPYIYLLVSLLIADTDNRLRERARAGTLATIAGMYLYIVLPGLGFHQGDAEWGLISISAIVALLALNYRVVWKLLQRVSEAIGNSRHDWLFAGGRFRIINHSLYSGLAGAVGVGIVAYVLGNVLAALILLLFALLGAALFAQILWGSGALMRPFGYWGAVLGCIPGALLLFAFLHIPLVSIMLATVLSAPFVQAIGRLRCLVQGCCHGVVTSKDSGIRIWQPQSRVVVISGLQGQYILNTQLYSIVFNLPLGLLLWSLWLSRGASSFFIIGLYLILTGIERFTEDAYRGEKQTRFSRGLRENQWIAVAALVIGIGVTILPAALPSKPSGTVDLALFVVATLGGLVTAFAMSMDFPKSTLRFSRLSG